MAATNVTAPPGFAADTPWTQYYCSATNPCTVDGFSCHYNKYCIPTLPEGETCLDAKDTVAPFVARVDNVYTLYCDMPNDIRPQTTKCPLGCEKWEDCHGDICFLKKCTKDQTACKNGDIDMCMGKKREEIICYEAIPHGKTHPQAIEEKGLSSSQQMISGAFFMVRRRRAAKAKKALEQALPTYSAHDEKNAMKQVSSSA
ncbi:hypothetical protein BGZ70_002924 [Mortierella alpina]|uniref:Uncharacterized protein n=1 Tax=Mortierella alpina TaxID=64518 RepID=A0A9P6M5E2_MORAP|nr:hypothetical protein BGZ70_002924 [Mortierella alpina]